ncbi:APA family fibronectin-binding glycoprotein [Mycobacteroides abscessus]|uniref:APA family fibronectin-binding glycoprotein n=1 Tax=Mycobacteroides abscessus TaxID=36809 RepID=UPI0013F641CB|nr:APA family fibronectin-binding glycoprotein [Mycobacteroides abscessus]
MAGYPVVTGSGTSVFGAPAMTIRSASTDTPFPPAADSVRRIDDAEGKFSFAAPAGWERSGGQPLTYGTTLLTNPAAPDGVMLLGPLDLKLFAGTYPSYPNNRKSAIRLASDMGTFLMPYPGNRINSDDQVFDVDGVPAATAYYETKYDDPQRDNSQLWVAVVGYDVNRFFALWRGTPSSPIDRAAAQAMAESIRPY